MAAITIAGSGQAPPEKQLPIDINYNKFLEWLLSRRKVNEKWNDTLADVRQRITAALTDMPDVPQITELVRDSYINYFHCLEIVEVLKVSEADTKNMFGMYSSQRMKDWRAIVAAYEKDNLYLAECARILTQEVNYEIPAMKAQIARANKELQDLARRETESAKNAVVFRQKYAQQCQELGIKGENLVLELKGMVGQIPNIYKEAVRLAQLETVGKAVEFYQTFVSYLIDQPMTSAHITGMLTELRTVRTHGNEALSVRRKREGGAAAEASSGITMDGGDAVISIASSGTVGAAVVDVGAIVDAGAPESVFDHMPLRNAFLNDVCELKAFLTQRLSEMETDTSALAVTFLQRAPQVVQQTTTSSLESYITAIDQLFEAFNSPSAQRLFLIKASPRYVERLAESLSSKLRTAEKLAASVGYAAETRTQLQATLASTVQRLAAHTTQVKKLQQQSEQAISRMFGGRPVNINGDINNLR